VRLLEVGIDALREGEVVDHVLGALARGDGGWIVTPNLDHLRRLVNDPSFRELCAGADLVVADGMPLVWASRLQGTPLPERVAGSNLIFSLTAAAAQSGHSVFFLGGDPGTAETASARLRERHPTLRVAGVYCPPLGFERDPALLSELRAVLARSAPDVVWVALGSPKQERLIRDLRCVLPRSWWLGVGISFSFVSGAVRRAPRWAQVLGLEWLHRLVQEPRRLFRRYLIDGLPFAVRLFAGALRARGRRGARA
jgi:N-acetylglucosaminyldiphosphoundecaprenol N-acetyl-beta-D-mannosaminyltransferase